MPKPRINPVRLAFAATGLIVLVFLAVAVFQRQISGDVAGKWKLYSIGGVKLPHASADQGIDIAADGTFSWPNQTVTGTWKIDGASLVLHPTKYDGKTSQQFHAETAAKFPSDASMQKIADKVFEDLKLTVGGDYSTLTFDLGGAPQIYRRTEGG